MNQIESAPQSQPSPIKETAEARSEPSPSKRRGRRRRVAFIVVLLGLGGGFAWWEAEGEDRYVPKRFGVVVPGKIYRSGQISKWQIEDILVRHKITKIVDFTGFDWNDEFQQYELKIAWKHKIAVNRYPQSGDGTGDIDNYAQALRDMFLHEQANKPLLVHCAAGSQRTGAAVAFYRMLVQKKTPDEALQEMRRYDCNPASNGRLITYINENMEELAHLLVKYYVIAKVPDVIPQLAP